MRRTYWTMLTLANCWSFSVFIDASWTGWAVMSGGAVLVCLWKLLEVADEGRK
jgi:hypothetical protein